MECHNHASVEALERCVGCAEAFCENCLVEVLGQKYCSGCKVIALQGPAPVLEGNVPCELAKSALHYSILGFFCLGIVFGPIAISKALQARKQIREDPRLEGLAKANVALLLGITVLVIWAVGVVARAKGKG